MCGAPQSGATTYTYDATGKQLTETVTATNKVTNGYNASGQLALAVRVNGATTTTQARAYSPDGRLSSISNTVGAAAPTTRLFDWDVTGGVVAQLLAFSTTGTAMRDLVGGPTGWIGTRTGPTAFVLGTDVYGSVLATTGVASVARSTAYTAYGNPTGGNVFEPRLGYRGELQLDNLVHLRARQYQPGVGQFTTTDPLQGVAGTPTIANPYHYADNTPLMRIDPTGMSGADDTDFNPFGGFATIMPPVVDVSTVVTAGQWASVMSSWALPAAGGTLAAGTQVTAAGGLTAAATAAAVPAAIVGTSVYTGWVISKVPGEIKKWVHADAEVVNSKAKLADTRSRIQILVDEGRIEEGVYGKEEYERQTSSDGNGNSSGPPPSAGSCSSDGEDVSSAATNEHHSDPMYLGGARNQKLTKMLKSDHVDLHRAMQEFMETQTDGQGNDMRHRCNNSGADIIRRFGRSRVLQALAEFYRGPGARWAEASTDFFKQHPGL